MIEIILQHFKPDVFNMILQEIKDNLIGTRYSPFWKMVASEGVTLISNAESDSSAITQEQAVQVLLSYYLGVVGQDCQI